MDPYIVYEDDIFIVFYKPPYYIMDTSNPKYNKIDNINMNKLFKNKIKPFHIYVRNYLIKHYNEYHIKPSYGCCQRLDINTSGMVLVSKKKKNFNLCRNIISDKKNTIKIYLCLVNGLVHNKNGFIKKNIKCKKKPLICKTIDYNLYNKKSLTSCSYYFVISEYLYNDEYYSLVCVRIFTGRTHQIRLHMKSMGNFLVSDDKYCPKNIYKNNLKIVKRMFLHNYMLSFFYKKNYNLKVNLPLDLLNALKKMKTIKKYKIDNNILLFSDKC